VEYTNLGRTGLRVSRLCLGTMNFGPKTSEADSRTIMDLGGRSAAINAFRTDFGVAFGGFKQSGIGREGGTEGLLPFLETKTVILEGRPAGYE